MSASYLIGDTRTIVAGIDDGSVDLVATSPPFLALRSYLPADHPDKAGEVGSETDPAAFVDTLLALAGEWGRVLAPHGSIAVELGDTYAGSGGGGGDYNAGGMRDGQPGFAGSASRAGVWPRPKCLALVPQLFAVGLAYGRNPITGAVSPAGRWLVRNIIVWHRPNPAVGALGDKFRPSTTYIVVATRSPQRWFDMSSVRGDYSPSTTAIGAVGTHEAARVAVGLSSGRGWTGNNPDGSPPLDAWFDGHDTWTITTQASTLAHYAMWPPRLAERLVLTMCPAEVCRTCGKPRRRIETRRRTFGDVTASSGRSTVAKQGGPLGSKYRVERGTTGWTDCGHGNYRTGVVLDPFAGTGTTIAVADLHGRHGIGIDIDARNAGLYTRRWDECKQVLYGVRPEMPGQLGLFESG